MMNLLTLIVGVMVGSLAASAVALVIMLKVFTNKKFLKKYMKWVVNTSKELEDIMYGEDDEEQ